jgi:hypothetical protein
MLKSEGQLCANWMEIPVEGKLHIPSCDFSAMISSEHFEEFCLPWLKEEVKPMDHNIFHLDGKGVARHIDPILEIPEIKAIQWVQGEGDDKPIMQWANLIQKIQHARKSVLVMLNPSELEEFCTAIAPEGIMLSIPSSSEDEENVILQRIKKWRN